jgi:uncharacterized protein DUF2785
MSTAGRQRRGCSAVLAAALALSSLAGAAEPRCPPDGFDRAALLDLRKQHFVITDDARRSALARALIGCLSSPDSELRDKIGYEAYAYWRIGKALDHDTWSLVESSLLAVLDGRDDEAGVARPFAALVLAEVVHADRDRPFLQKAQRSKLLDAAIRYFTSVRDYRGFDETTGWRHGVAHAADLLGQLALEPDFGRAELDRILAALAGQIVAHDDRVYVFGESKRIAEAVTHVAGRHAFSIEEWKAWLAAATAPAPLARWADAFDSSAGVAKHQNTMNFLLALYAELALSGDEQVRALAADVAVAMQPLR